MTVTIVSVQVQAISSRPRPHTVRPFTPKPMRLALLTILPHTHLTPHSPLPTPQHPSALSHPLTLPQCLRQCPQHHTPLRSPPHHTPLRCPPRRTPLQMAMGRVPPQLQPRVLPPVLLNRTYRLCCLMVKVKAALFMEETSACNTQASTPLLLSSTVNSTVNSTLHQAHMALL